MSQDLFGASLGLTPEVEHFYREIMGADGSRVEEAAAALLMPVERFLEELQPLVDLGVSNVTDGVLSVLPPRQAVGVYLERHAAAMVDSARVIARAAGAVRFLDPAPARAVVGSETLNAEVINGAAPVQLMETWVAESSGEVMLLRPDQWRLSSEPSMAAASARAVSQGRRVRAIYPVRALHQARSMLMDRHAAGEEVRLLPEVPSRMAIVGEDRALIPEHPGLTNVRAIVLRDSGIVAPLRLYFEELWKQAVALPVFEAHDVRQDARRLLLSEMADGARDEQIARTLGIGLRTVRRRIATLMLELGAETRFQAGVEAVRRGWV